MKGLLLSSRAHGDIYADPPPGTHRPFHRAAGTGDPVQLAQDIRTALGESKTPFGVKPPAQAASAGVDFDMAKVDAAISHKGKANGGIYHFGIPRADVIKMDGMAIPGAMGTAIGINFQPTGGGRRRSPETLSRYRAN